MEQKNQIDDKDLEQENILSDDERLEEEEEDRKYIIIFFIIALFLLIFIVVGFTYSIFEESIKGPAQPISAQVIFNYSDIGGDKNGIHLTNASAIEDSVGKKLLGKNNTFDFSIMGKNNSKIDIKYYIVLEEDKKSTLDSSNVKVYLTSLKGSNEEELFDDAFVIDSLKDIKLENSNYKILYEKVLHSRQKFSDEYRLRMWIKEDAVDYYGKNYSLRVNVYAEGISDKDE